MHPRLELSHTGTPNSGLIFVYTGEYLSHMISIEELGIAIDLY